MTEPIDTEPAGYLWAVRITTEYLSYPNAKDRADESDPHVDETHTRIQECNGEDDARRRVKDFDYVQQQRAAGQGHRHPRYQRISAMDLLRRPVGAWEVRPR